MILNGARVDDIPDATKHTFVGTFRPPLSALLSGPGVVYVMYCTCGKCLYTHEALQEHWQRGCFDEPQYVTLRSPQSADVT
jgi:hypothetical protein